MKTTDLWCSICGGPIGRACMNGHRDDLPQVTDQGMIMGNGTDSPQAWELSGDREAPLPTCVSVHAGRVRPSRLMRGRWALHWWLIRRLERAAEWLRWRV